MLRIPIYNVVHRPLGAHVNLKIPLADHDDDDIIDDRASVSLLLFSPWVSSKPLSLAKNSQPRTIKTIDQTSLLSWANGRLHSVYSAVLTEHSPQ